MFYEYAVDPECYADAEQIDRLTGEFGWCEGRLISNFPRTWLRKVKEAQDAVFKQLSFRKKGVLTAELDRLRRDKDKIFINSGRNFDGNDHWTIKALREHKNKPFQAIIAHEKPLQSDDILLPNELNGREPRWKIRHDDRVPRSPEALCNCVSKLLQESYKIRFVDPYFNPNKKEWISTLSAFLRSSSISEFEYHIKIKDEIKLDDINEIKNGVFELKKKKWYQKFSQNCQDKIKPILPLGQKIVLYLWCEIESSNDWFHDRYILTEKGGVRFEGLDEGEKPGQRTNVFRLSKELWRDRWNSLENGSEAYQFLGTVEVPEE